MSNLADLANSFQYMGLEKKQPKYHELQIEYPVLDLLPAEQSVVPFLKPPSFNGYREKPDPSEYHLPLSGTEFIVRLPLTNEMPSTSPKEVFAALMQLLAAPGRSLLQICTYFDSEDGDHYRFRLLAERNGGFQIVAENELSDIAWSAVRNFLRRETWMRLISHLIGRISYRAYFHVHERLQHYRWYNKQISEEQWNYRDSFDPKRFFAANLRVLVTAPLGGRYTDPVDAYDLMGNGEQTFQLPCKHLQDLFIPELRSLSIAGCMRFECHYCGERLARIDNGWRTHLLFQHQRLKRARFSVRELVWQRIEDDFPVGNQQVVVSSTVLCKALQYAADSVMPPETASPLALHPTKSADFPEIISEFWSQLQGEYEVRCTSAEIFSGLVDKLDRAVGRVDSSGRETGNLQSLPRVWEALVLLWFTRATQLAGILGYDGREPLTVFDNQASDDEGSVQEEEEDEEMDELDQLMKGAKLF